MHASNNPLLGATELPDFAAICAEHVEPAVSQVLAAERQKLAALQAVAVPTVEWLKELERIHERVHRVWAPVEHLNAVVSNSELREAYNHCLGMITEFSTELGQNEALYQRFEALADQLTEQQAVEAALVKQNLRDFKLAGVALQGTARQRFRDLMQELSAKQAAFEQNVMDATDAFSYYETDLAMLAGVPEVALERARQAARDAGLDGWRFVLDPPTYQTILSHAEKPALRERYYRAWVTRASELGEGGEQWDNGPLIEEILALRHEAAQLLGFESFAELSLATKMAPSSEQVLDFLRDLADRSRPVATQELHQLEGLAGRRLQAWDVAYFSERLKQSRFDLAEEELRPYFPLPRVLQGMFGLTEQLFGIRIEAQSSAPNWHPSVEFHALRDAAGVVIGGFFTDLFARANKRGGAWMDNCLDRASLDSLVQKPVAHLVCNFNPPVGDAPCLLTHGDVVTLFHEFGHTLHHLLTEVDYPSLAGINGVAWDAVELPSQFMENFAWHPEVLQRISGHYQTAAPLPADKVQKLNESRGFLAGLAMLRQLEFALFDFLLHDCAEPPAPNRVSELMSQVRSEVAVVTHPDYNRFAHSFGHVFAGGYAAGYYSYKWAEVLAADAFAAFEERGVFDAATADRFRRCILAVGGSRNALTAFCDFRGRPPELGPLLRQSGIEAA